MIKYACDEKGAYQLIIHLLRTEDIVIDLF